MERTPEAWADYCERNITAGFTPTGGKRAVPESGRKLADILYVNQVLRENDVVVDVGCGNGRLAFGLLGRPVTAYHGLEIIPACVSFCRAAFADEPHYRFYHLDAGNGRYWPQGSVPAEEVIYPLPDGIADVVVCESLFSHTATLEAAARNLSEIARCLRNGGRFWSTWYLDPPERVSADPARTVYPLDKVLALLDDDFIPLSRLVLDGQDAFLCERK